MPGRMNRGVPITEEDVARWIRQGYGQGEGARYKPWFTVRDVPSRGRSHRPPCLKSGREIHLLSDREMACFLYAQFSPVVVDIREQFALLPRASTETIADGLGVRHPRYFGSGVSQVMTTDFVLTLRTANAGTRYLAISVKPSDKLVPCNANRRTLELAEIERLYWSSRGIEWRWFTDRHIDRAVLTALQKLFLWRIAYSDTPAEEHVHSFVAAFLRDVEPVENLSSRLERACADAGVPAQVDKYGMLAYAIWLGLIALDLTEPLGPLNSVQIKTGG